MHFRFKQTIVLWAVVLFAVSLPASLKAQQPQYDSLFQKASQLEEQHKDRDALIAYTDIERSQHTVDPEAAAESLYREMLFSDTHYGVTSDEKRQGHKNADDLWQQLIRDYPTSRAAPNALEYQLKKAEDKGGL